MQERGTECGGHREWEYVIFREMSSNILGNVFKHSGECHLAFQGMSSNIPGNVSKHSRECPLQTLRRISSNIPGNVPRILGNVLKHSEESLLLKEMRTQGQFKISSCFCVWCESRELVIGPILI